MSSRQCTRGFSLVETIIALGLLGAVLVAISGLFVLGNQSVRGGRTRSVAIAEARHMVEQLNASSFDQIDDAFGLSGTSDNYTVDTQTNALTTAWQARLEEALPGDPYALIRLESVVESGTPPDIRDAAAVRITVEVHWQQLGRASSVDLSTVRF